VPLVVLRRNLQAYRLLVSVYNTRADLPQSLALLYVVGTLVLQVLNWFWYALYTPPLS
jgi:hypothetical protein